MLVQKAIDMPLGQTIGYVRDSNGFLMVICSPPLRQQAMNEPKAIGLLVGLKPAESRGQVNDHAHS